MKRVLIWNLDSIGDALMVTPSLRAARAIFPHAEITVFCAKAAHPVFRGNPNVDRCVVSIEELSALEFTVVFILEMGSRPADHARLWCRRRASGSPYVVSTHLGHLKALCHRLLPENKSEYWPRYFLRAFEGFGSIPPAELEFHPTLRVEPMSGRTVVLHPLVASYARATKQWPIERFVDLAIELAAEADLVFSGGPEDQEVCERLAAQVRAHRPNAVVRSIAGSSDLAHSAAIFRSASLVIACDTAALHLAVSQRTPTLALFGATDEVKLAPSSVRVLAKNLPCRPCHRYTDEPSWPVCLFDEPKCLTSISVAEVATVAREMLRGGASA